MEKFFLCPQLIQFSSNSSSLHPLNPSILSISSILRPPPTLHFSVLILTTSPPLATSIPPLILHPLPSPILHPSSSSYLQSSSPHPLIPSIPPPLLLYTPYPLQSFIPPPLHCSPPLHSSTIRPLKCLPTSNPCPLCLFSS
jgi:hypothetical protein